MLLRNISEYSQQSTKRLVAMQLAFWCQSPCLKTFFLGAGFACCSEQWLQINEFQYCTGIQIGCCPLVPSANDLVSDGIKLILFTYALHLDMFFLEVCLIKIHLTLTIFHIPNSGSITDIKILNNGIIIMRKIKPGKRGEVTKYISRAKAIRKLQLSLKDFRRLCIMKGVYPREPPKKLKKHNRTYYHLKDINFLSLDPLISKLRAQKVYMNKYRKAKAKGDIGKIKYLVQHKPKISLNHLVRERYPDFIDALRDLDDPLSLMALFSIFPTHKEFNLSTEKIEACTKLLKHFELYVIQSHSLQKVFVSIKGIYYQAEIMGQKVTYIVPYKYPPNLPIDVDYRVMCTFLDFYVTLLKFVNYKLYQTIGYVYPPDCVEESSSAHYMNYEFRKPQSLAENDDEKYKIDEEFQNIAEDSKSKNLLFSGLHFYLSTEVPRDSLEYVILAMGGTVTYEFDASNQAITHVITDREKANVTVVASKEYVQPQWVYDSINFKKLLNVKDYWHNLKELPAHISPFFDENDAERYIPDRERELAGLPTAQAVSDKKQTEQQLTDKYDIVAEKKRALSQKKKEKKQFAQISKNVISSTNKKLLKVIEHGREKKREAKSRLQDKRNKIAK